MECYNNIKEVIYEHLAPEIQRIHPLQRPLKTSRLARC